MIRHVASSFVILSALVASCSERDQDPVQYSQMYLHHLDWRYMSVSATTEEELISTSCEGTQLTQSEYDELRALTLAAPADQSCKDDPFDFRAIVTANKEDHVFGYELNCSIEYETGTTRKMTLEIEALISELAQNPQGRFVSDEPC